MNEEDILDRAAIVESRFKAYATMRSALDSAAYANHKQKTVASAMLPQRFQSLYAKASVLRVLQDPEILRAAIIKADADLTAIMVRISDAGIEFEAIEDMIRAVNDVADGIRHSSDVSEVAVRSYVGSSRGAHAPTPRPDRAEEQRGPGERPMPAGWQVVRGRPDPAESIPPDPAGPAPK